MSEKKKLTIKDVARATGLAPSTVSNALAGKSLVKPETRDYVREVAERLGYRASVVARSLRSQRSFAIGVLIEDVANPSAAAFVRGVEDGFDRTGYTLLLANTDGDIQKQVAAMKALMDRGVDGLVLISQHLADARVQEILAAAVPTVVVQRREPSLKVDYVGGDNYGGIREALRYVSRSGHQRVGLLTGPLLSSSARERLAAFRESVEAFNLHDAEDLICEGRYNLESGLEAAGFFSCMPQPPTCILASSDMSAIGLMQGLAERGLMVPRDISVIGLDDIDIARIKAIDLTTIRLEKREIGAEAARLLLKRIDDPDSPIQTVILPTRLIVRGTTAPASRST